MIPPHYSRICCVCSIDAHATGTPRGTDVTTLSPRNYGSMLAPFGLLLVAFVEPAGNDLYAVWVWDVDANERLACTVSSDHAIYVE